LPIADKTKKLDEEKVINGKSRGIYLPTYLVSVFDVKQEKIKITLEERPWTLQPSQY